MVHKDPITSGQSTCPPEASTIFTIMRLSVNVHLLAAMKMFQPLTNPHSRCCEVKRKLP